MKITDIIITPKMTEKSVAKAKQSVYVFEVNKAASKNQIKSAVAEIFSVKVKEVKTSVRKGKTKKTGKRRIEKNVTDKKIAFVKVDGKIELFPKK